MIEVMWPCDRQKTFISSTWKQHIARPGYNAAFAGTDLACNTQIPIIASQNNGTVLFSGWSTQGYGNMTFTEYTVRSQLLRVRNCHQKSMNVKVGDKVNAGDLMGVMNSTGNSTGTHDHFEVWLQVNGLWKNLDPLDSMNSIYLVDNVTGGEPPVEPEIIIPEFPTPVEVRILADPSLTVREAETTSSKAVGKIEKDKIVVALGARYVGKDLWINIGYHQYIAMLYYYGATKYQFAEFISPSAYFGADLNNIHGEVYVNDPNEI